MDHWDMQLSLSQRSLMLFLRLVFTEVCGVKPLVLVLADAASVPPSSDPLCVFTNRGAHFSQACAQRSASNLEHMRPPLITQTIGASVYGVADHTPHDVVVHVPSSQAAKIRCNRQR